MSLQHLVEGIKHDREISPNIITWRVEPERAADYADLPIELASELRGLLESAGIRALYSHQFEAWQRIKEGEHVVICTPTASGKSLAYNLPILDALIADSNVRALYLYPTKALTQDQANYQMHASAHVGGDRLKPAIYDGDTPSSARSKIRASANIILSNPDMLHTGILPHHTLWSSFFQNLHYVVIDEVHTYRGVFGSHFANVIRRLLRVAAHYGAFPQLIMTSATIANPKEHAERVTGKQVSLIHKDGSARGEKHFVLLQPPLIDAGLGLRASSAKELMKVADQALDKDIQTIVFTRARRSVEILLRSIRERIRKNESFSVTKSVRSTADSVMGYRSGYLPAERRAIEKDLREGKTRMVVATNALELGIDIGRLDLSLLFGYPGTIASLRQQAGRAGRGVGPSMAVLVLTAFPIDQYLARHIEYIFDRDPEMALIDPNHPIILLEHLRCALFELPFAKGERFGDLDVGEFLDFIVANGQAHSSADKTFWMSQAYPASEVSLRNASPNVATLIIDEHGKDHVIGKIDVESSYWMAHPKAIYFHGGEQYLVTNFDFEKGEIRLARSNAEHFTDPERTEEIELLQIQNAEAVKGGAKTIGEIIVHTRVVGFRKRLWGSGEIIDRESIEMPESTLNTVGYWISLSAEALRKIQNTGMWTNSPNDYGLFWQSVREQVRRRDKYACQVCGAEEKAGQHEVHHIVPFREIIRRGMSEEYQNASNASPILIPQSLIDRANRLDNLITLCEPCHHRVEQNVRMRSGLAGLGSVLKNLASFRLMCDAEDIGMYFHPEAELTEGAPTVVLYDLVPSGIGFSAKLYKEHHALLIDALDLVESCPCDDGCPACVGPAGENGVGGKMEVIAILREMI